MDASTLAVKMLSWEHTQRAADELRAEIEAAVLEVGKTQTVGNVRATYSKGRTSLDYETAAMEHPLWGDIGGAYQRVSYDYKRFCDETGVDNIPIKSQSEPSVTLKLLA